MSVSEWVSNLLFPKDTEEVIDWILGAINLLVLCFFAGIVIIVLFALKSASYSDFLSMVGVGILLASCVGLTGALLGFLFGIPRTLQGSGPPKSESNDITANVTDKKTEGKSSLQSDQYQANTNLEQISDWLTKILVGVGLTQLISLPVYLQAFGVSVAPAFGGSPNGGAFAIGILIFYAIDGFLIGYFWTRRFFAQGLELSDMERKKLHDLQTKISDLKNEYAANEEALRLVNDILNRSVNLTSITQNELNKKIESASPDFKRLFYYKSASERYKHWNDKQFMERIEMIFRALIYCDKQNAYHNNHGQLGYILLERQNPEAWKAAIDEFTAAIQIRDTNQIGNHLWYEFDRALCRINLDEEFKTKKPCTDDLKKKICDDISAAATQPDVKESMLKSPSIIVEWTTINNCSF